MWEDIHQSNSGREWLLTNGKGGYALGFGDMINKRKYNGLLISSFDNFERIHTVSSVEERVDSLGSAFYLDSNHYVGSIYPEGYNHIVKSWLRPYPAVLYSSMPFADDYLIFKEIFMLQGANAVAVRYTNPGRVLITLVLHPKFTLRNHHALNKPYIWDSIATDLEVGDLSFRFKRSDTGAGVFGYISSGHLVKERFIYRGVYYPMEAMRGYDSVEDLISPVRITIPLEAGTSSYVVFSSGEIDDLSKRVEEAEAYYKGFPLPHDRVEKGISCLGPRRTADPEKAFNMEEYRKILCLAAGDFVAGSDIIAGYPWFSAWGRDTMISLSGLRFLDGGRDKAIAILKKYGQNIRNGLLPNTSGEGGRGSNYESVDAPLWFVLRCYEYAPKDRDLLAFVSKVILGYMNAENNAFYMDSDGLIDIRRGRHALTWMDAKVHGEPVTPRWGKPVEVNALWYNAVSSAIEMITAQRQEVLAADGQSIAVAELKGLKERIRKSLEKYYGDDYLADRIEDGQPVFEVRPNAVIALSLPFEWAGADVVKNVWKKAKEELFTLYGLRSLSPHHPAFKVRYVGDQRQRDYAYHQGTVWTYLLLPFALLTEKIFVNEGRSANLSREFANCTWSIRNGFLDGDRASVAEVWDGMEPSMPKGCPAQAWSVFALLEIENLIEKYSGKRGKGE